MLEEMAVRRAALPIAAVSKMVLAAKTAGVTDDASLVRRALELLTAWGVVGTAWKRGLAPDVGAGVVAATGAGPGAGLKAGAAAAAAAAAAGGAGAGAGAGAGPAPSPSPRPLHPPQTHIQPSHNLALTILCMHCYFETVHSEASTAQLGYSRRRGSSSLSSGTHTHRGCVDPGDSNNCRGTPAQSRDTPPLLPVHHTAPPAAEDHLELHGGSNCSSALRAAWAAFARSMAAVAARSSGVGDPSAL